MRSRIRFHDDRGIATITAILVMMIMTALSLTAFAVSSHDLSASGGDRSRVQSVSAAEAGLDRFFLVVQQTPSAQVPCGTPLANQPLAIAPSAQYSVSVTYYDANQGVITCAGGVPTSTPSGILIRSVGTEGTSTRTMESFVRLTPAAGGSFGNDAIYAGTTFTDSGQANVIGNPDNGDVYSNGNLVMSGGGTVNGAVRTQGTLIMSGGTQVKRDLTVEKSITMSGGSIAWGNANSATSLINVSGGGTTIKGDANACTGIVNSGTINGAQHPTACPAPPPVEPWPGYTYNQSNWTGYTVNTYTGSNACTNAIAFLTTLNGTQTAGNQLVRISGTNCQLSISGGKNIKPKGDLAIVSDGSLAISGGSTFSNPDGPSNRHKLLLMFSIGQTPGGSCPNPSGITLSGQTMIDSNLDTLLYTPCSVVNSGGTLVATGQIYADNFVNLSGGTSLTFKGIVVPGLSGGYFNQDIAYIREVI